MRRRNLIHASDGFDSATKEIGLWFDEAELSEYEPIAWVSSVVVVCPSRAHVLALGHGRQLDLDRLSMGQIDTMNIITQKSDRKTIGSAWACESSMQTRSNEAHRDPNILTIATVFTLSLVWRGPQNALPICLTCDLHISSPTISHSCTCYAHRCMEYSRLGHLHPILSPVHKSQKGGPLRLP